MYNPSYKRDISNVTGDSIEKFIKKDYSSWNQLKVKTYLTATEQCKCYFMIRPRMTMYIKKVKGEMIFESIVYSSHSAFNIEYRI